MSLYLEYEEKAKCKSNGFKNHGIALTDNYK